MVIVVNILYTMFWENENYWHWTHDGEVLKALIPALGYMFVGVVTWLGIWRTSKIAKQTLEDTREGTPPELLRLEKWSTILTDSKNYPKNIKRELDVNTIQSTYNDVLKGATLENRVMKLGILSSNVRNELISVNKIGVGYGVYPRPEWGGPKPNLEMQIKILFVILCIYVAISVALIFSPYTNVALIVFIIFMFIFFVLVYKPSKRKEETLRENNIVFRNGYHALKDIYLIRNYEGVQETPKENKEREDFEKTKEYKEWRDKVKKDHPDWSSWNYGLSINWDNRPYKNNTNGLEPNHLPSSLFRAEDLKRQEP